MQNYAPDEAYHGKKSSEWRIYSTVITSTLSSSCVFTKGPTSTERCTILLILETEKCARTDPCALGGEARLG